MRLSVKAFEAQSVKRSDGNFGSDGKDHSDSASLELEIEATLDNLERIIESYRRAFALADQVLAERATRRVGHGDAYEPPAAAPSPAPPAKPEPSSARRLPTHRWNGKQCPQTGKQMWGWLCDLERESRSGVVEHLKKWARRAGIEGRVCDWQAEDVAAAVKVTERFIEQARVNGAAQ